LPLKAVVRRWPEVPVAERLVDVDDDELPVWLPVEVRLKPVPLDVRLKVVVDELPDVVDVEMLPDSLLVEVRLNVVVEVRLPVKLPPVDVALKVVVTLLSAVAKANKQATTVAMTNDFIDIS